VKLQPSIAQQYMISPPSFVIKQPIAHVKEVVASLSVIKAVLEGFYQSDRINRTNSRLLKKQPQQQAD
jgi:hypothetical protein